jgi:hypothetical protein
MNLDCAHTVKSPQLMRRPLMRIMPIDVLWEIMDWEVNPAGPAPIRMLKAVRDDHSLVESFLVDLDEAEFPYLSFINHETVTVFHQQHIGQLIAELEALSRREHDPSVATHLHGVLQLVSGARGRKDTLVAFRARKSEDAA